MTACLPRVSRIGRAASILAACLAFGCASYPPPDMQLAASRSAIEKAAPVAERELALARSKMELAQRLSARGAQEEARWLAEQAEADAELVIATALATSAAEEAAQSRQSAADLKLRLVRASAQSPAITR